MINSMEKKKTPLSENQLLLENEELRQRVYEYEETLNSIRNGEIDAIVVSGVDGEKIYSLTSVETKYRIIIEEMNEGAITTSGDGLITYCNARFAELVSEPMERLVGSYFVNYLQESEQQIFSGLLQSGLKGKIVGQITYKLKSGQILELQLSMSPMPADIQNGVCIMFSDITQLKQQEKELLLLNSKLDEKVIEKTSELIRINQEFKALHIVSMSMMEDAVEARIALENTNANLRNEIIERKKSEDELNASESKFRQTFDLSPVGIVMVGHDKRFIRTNKAFSAFTGYEAEELMGKTISEVTHPDDIKIGMSDMGAIIKGEIVKSQVQKRYLTKDGQIAWGETMISLVRDSSGNPQYFLAIIQDITVRRQVEEALKESEQKFRDTITYLDEGYYSVTLDGILLDHNQAFNQILGFDTVIDLKGKKLPDFWQNPNERDDYLKEFAVNGSISNYLINAKKQNKDKITVLANAHLVYDKDNQPLRIEGVFLDITERIHAEEKIKRQVEELKRFNNTMVDREIKMIELKEEINSYYKKLNLADKYSIPEGFKRK
jgi:PAS domain S-box-containing protein